MSSARRAAALAVFAMFAAPAAYACAPGDPHLAGRFELQGVHEVGSQLRLGADGRFAYMLAYGALDEAATGCWSLKGGVVTLVATKFEASMEDPMKFRRLDLPVTKDGDLARRFGPDVAGTYRRY